VKICESITAWKNGKRVGDLFHAIRRHQLVHWFDLQGCMLGNDRVKKGLEMLQTVKSLKTVDLQDNEIDRACLPAIQEFLRASNVRALYLQGNSLNTRDFDVLEPFVSKLGRECTVYCYKDKDQPMRKLICSTVKQAGGFDESLSFSSVQLNSIFKQYKDRVSFVETAAAEEMVYSHKSKKNSESYQAATSAAVDEASVAVQHMHTENAVGDSAVLLGDETVGDLQSDVVNIDDSHLPLGDADHDTRQDLAPSAIAHARLEPKISSSLQAAPRAASPSLIDSIVAMGFKLEAAEVAYAKSNGDVQVRHVFIPWFGVFH
jgi:hypothetical protein